MDPLAPGQEAVWVPLAHISLGIDSIKDPNCAITADRGNTSLLDPIRLGSLYAATASNRSDGSLYDYDYDYDYDGSLIWPGTVRVFEKH